MSAAPSSSSGGAAVVPAAPPQAGAQPSAAQSVDFLTLLQHLKSRGPATGGAGGAGPGKEGAVWWQAGRWAGVS